MTKAGPGHSGKAPRHRGRRPRKARRGTGSPQARRFTAEERQLALEMLGRGVAVGEVAVAIGTTTESLRRWRQQGAPKAQAQAPAASAASGQAKAKKEQPSDASRTDKPRRKAPAAPPPRPSVYAPQDPGQGLSEQEVAGILEWKRTHPSMGPAQLRAQLKRFRGWRLSLKAIARVLRLHGYEPVHRGSRPKGDEFIRFEAPRRNALWQADFAEVRVHSERLYVLIILDDFSRFVVGHALCDSPTSAVATATLKAAIARHGKPEAVRTDRGGAFVAATKEDDFACFLERELIDPIRGRPYQPRGGGKVESAVATLRRELWELAEFTDRHEANGKLSQFFEDYNYRRAHMGIDGLTPADRFFGRADQVLATINAISRQRQGVLAGTAKAGSAIEELVAADSGGPFEVLRLVIEDGVMELRFCGARVKLGGIQPL